MNTDEIDDPKILAWHRKATGTIAGLMALVFVAGAAWTYQEYSAYQENASKRETIQQAFRDACGEQYELPEQANFCTDLGTYLVIDDHRNDALLGGIFSAALLVGCGMLGWESRKAGIKLAGLENGSGQAQQHAPEL